MTDLEKLVQTAVGKVPSLDDQQKKERHSPILYSLDLDYDEIQCLQTNEIFLNKTTCLLNILLCPLLINTKKMGRGDYCQFFISHTHSSKHDRILKVWVRNQKQIQNLIDACRDIKKLSPLLFRECKVCQVVLLRRNIAGYTLFWKREHTCLAGISQYCHVMWMVRELHTDVLRWFPAKYKLNSLS